MVMCPQPNNGPFTAFTGTGVSAVTTAGQRCKFNTTSGVFELAGATESGVGVCARKPNSQDHAFTLIPLNSSGTIAFIADGAVTPGPVYAAANGKVSASGSILLGHALTTAADGQQVEVCVHLSTVAVTPVSNVAAIDTPESATAADCAAKINAILSAIKTGGLMTADAE